MCKSNEMLDLFEKLSSISFEKMKECDQEVFHFILYFKRKKKGGKFGGESYHYKKMRWSGGACRRSWSNPNLTGLVRCNAIVAGGVDDV